MLNIKKAIFVAPHPDDETLGCGGSIQKLKENDCEIFWIIVTKGYEKDGFDINDIKLKEKQVDKVKSLYSFNDTFKLDLRSSMLDCYSLREIIIPLKNIFDSIKPDTIFIPHKHDVHSDHKIIFEAIWSASKSFRSPSIKNILSYETLSETEAALPNDSSIFKPNLFIDISKYLNKKIEIMKIYSDEISDHPFPRSLEGLKSLAKFRGATINVHYAEAFMSHRIIL